MRPSFRSMIVASLVASASLSFMPLGCGGIDPTIRQQATRDHFPFPRITAERFRQCGKEYGDQLEPGSWAFNPIVRVHPDGHIVDVDVGHVPNTAPDFAACIRSALRDMVIPSSVFHSRPTQLATAANKTTITQHNQLGSPAVLVVVVVEVVLTEIVLEAGVITILFATTVKVVDEAAKDVAEAAKRWRPKPNKNRCLDADAGGEYLWEEFCRSMKVPGSCWSKTYESEQNKRGWCNEKFGS